jgi:hypothetical protein
MANNQVNQMEIQRFLPEDHGLKLKAIIAKQEKRLNNIKSSALKVANYYFVFQGVILTVVINGSQSQAVRPLVPLHSLYFGNFS